MESGHLSRQPKNCYYNTRFRVKDQGRVGFCQNKSVLEKANVRVLVCNDDDFAGSCCEFLCRHTKESVRESFMRILESPARCGEVFPKLAVLLWVVQNKRKDHAVWARTRGRFRAIFTRGL
jgi:hypothetical protein